LEQLVSSPMSLMKSDAATKVGQLCEDGQIEEAAGLAHSLLSHFPADNDLNAELAGYFYAACEFDEVLDILSNFRDAAKRELRADFSIEEVIAAKERNFSAPGSYPVSFRRMSFWERGHFSNRFHLSPILLFSISKSHFEIRTRFKNYRYAIRDVLGVDLLLEAKRKGYGAGASVGYTRRTLVIRTVGRVFKIDVSVQHADFKNSKLFEGIMSELFDVNKIDMR
jgi:hypothetical protein